MRATCSRTSCVRGATGGASGARARSVGRVTDRAFRFALQVQSAVSRVELRDTAVRAEDAGFDALVMGDHVLDGSLSPLVALATVAEATPTLGIGTCTVNSDLHV